MKLLWMYGEEAVCPKCGGHNACIGNANNTYTCRDCKTIYAVIGKFKQIGKDDVLDRPIVEAECVVVNSLTKGDASCSGS